MTRRARVLTLEDVHRTMIALPALPAPARVLRARRPREEAGPPARHVLGPTGPRLRRSRARVARPRARAGRTRREPHRSRVHRGRLRRLPDGRAAPEGVRHHPASRSADAPGCATRISPRRSAARPRRTSRCPTRCAPAACISRPNFLNSGGLPWSWPWTNRVRLCTGIRRPLGPAGASPLVPARRPLRPRGRTDGHRLGPIRAVRTPTPEG